MKVKRLIPRAVELIQQYAWSAATAAKVKHQYDNLQCYCMFIGYPRSGHTLVGSLLDAHRHVVIGLELDALRYVKFGFSRNQLFTLLTENSRWHARQGRQWTGYSYQVPNQWQGRTEAMKIIGDKRGGDSSRRLAKSYPLFERLRRKVGVPVKIIHAVRNPYDNVSTMTLRKDADNLDVAMDDYLSMVDVAERVRKDVGPANFHTLHHEDLIAAPHRELKAMCDFLGVDAPEDYLNDCAGILFESPRKTRAGLAWTDAQLQRMAKACAEHDFLRRYTYADEPAKSA